MITHATGKAGSFGRPVPRPGHHGARTRTTAVMIGTSDTPTFAGEIGLHTNLTVGRGGERVVHELAEAVTTTGFLKAGRCVVVKHSCRGNHQSEEGWP